VRSGMGCSAFRNGVIRVPEWGAVRDESFFEGSASLEWKERASSQPVNGAIPARFC